jgi:hypothetical protein
MEKIMTVNLQVFTYSDFKTVVDDILTMVTGRVYWQGVTNFQCVFVANDTSRVVLLNPNPAIAEPASFATDFPGAIQITNYLSFPQMGPSNWTVFGA